MDDIGDSHPYTGAFLNVEIQAQTITDAIQVSRRAVYEASYVFLVENGLFRQRPVDIAFDEGDFYIIDTGLNNGDTLVTELLQGVSDGMPARAILPFPIQGTKVPQLNPTC